MIIEYIPLNLLETLTDLNKRDRLTVLTYLSSTLYYIHMRGITYRDIKPDNALVQRQGQELIIKLADFSTLKRNAIRKIDTFTRTEIYMAPELFVKR